jgi:prephenate dehydrogenase
MQPASIAIVGGRGRMGKLFEQFFCDAGYEVATFSRGSGPIPWEVVAGHDVIMLSVPISTVEGVLKELGPLTRQDGLVVDVSSLKEAPVRSMLQHCRGEVIGSHPLFGPTISSFNNHILFLCPARSERWIGWFRSVFEDRGVLVREIEPAAHDRLMATVQVLRHALIFCFGRSLMRLDFDLAAELPHSGQWFSQLAAMFRNQLGEKPELYPELAFPNPATDKVLECLVDAVSEITAAFRSHDRDGLIRMINEMADHFSSRA